MKLRTLLITVSLLLLSATGTLGFVIPGDNELNSALKDLNVSARMDYQRFRTDLHVSYNVSSAKVDYMYTTVRMEPAEIFMVLEFSSISHRPVDRVIEVYRVHRGRGWGVIARELGIRPGSAEFHALKGKAWHHSEKIKYRGEREEKRGRRHRD